MPQVIHHTTTTVLQPFFWDHLREPVPEENSWTLWCKGGLTKADTMTIWLGATPSGLTSAHLHHPQFLQARCPSCQSTNSVKALKSVHSTSHTKWTFLLNKSHNYTNNRCYIHNTIICSHKQDSESKGKLQQFYTTKAAQHWLTSVTGGINKAIYLKLLRQCTNSYRKKTCASPHTGNSTILSVIIDWLTCGFTSHSTQNRSFRRRSPSQWLVWKNKN